MYVIVYMSPGDESARGWALAEPALGSTVVALLRSRLDPYAAVPAVGAFLGQCATAL
jgi:hypothetical protein